MAGADYRRRAPRAAVPKPATAEPGRPRTPARAPPARARRLETAAPHGRTRPRWPPGSREAAPTVAAGKPTGHRVGETPAGQVGVRPLGETFGQDGAAGCPGWDEKTVEQGLRDAPAPMHGCGRVFSGCLSARRP